MVLGLDRRRIPPPWKHATFERWLAQHRQGTNEGVRQVTLFNDTFVNYFEPEIGIAALAILRQGGCKVNVVNPGCCGRPFISQGLLAEARQHAAAIVEALFPIAERGETILFCEPSCLSAVREDIPSLLREEEQRKAVEIAKKCVLFEEFAANLDLPLRERPGKILVHGHCHQKSMGMVPATLSMLGRIPGSTVINLDTGCCGMAGSFGYARRHYNVSTAIANHRLLPAVKKMERGDILVAPGTSCRRQLLDLGGVCAPHPAVLVASLLPSEAR